MSSKRKQGKSGASVPSAAKVNQMHKLFPELGAEVCESILISMDWNVERAINYLKQDSDQSVASGSGATQDWPALPDSPKPLHLSSRTVHTQSGYTTTTIASRKNGSTNSASMSSTSVSNANVFKYPPTRPPVVGPSNGKAADIIWKPVLSNYQKKKCDRQRLQEALDSELKFENTSKIIRLVSSNVGVRVPKVVILLRGVPGSGKSQLADIIVGVSEHGISCSADDHFINKHGNYVFNVKELPAAHTKCQQNCEKAMQEDITPIVIDNTNTQAWEMTPYVKLASNYGYEFELLEPNTSWKRNAKILTEKNSHGVAKSQIKRMLDRFETWTTASLKENLLNCVQNGTNITPSSEHAILKAENKTERNTEALAEPMRNILDHTTGVKKSACLNNSNNSTPTSKSSSVSNTDLASFWANPPNLQCPPVGHRKLSSSSSSCISQESTQAGDKNLLYSEVAQFRRNSIGSSSSSDSVPQKSVKSQYSVTGEEESNKLSPFASASASSVWDWENHLLDETAKNTRAESFFNNEPEKSPEVSPVNALLNLFPDLPATQLADLLRRCNNDLTLCADLLLEGGYAMCGDLEGPRQLESSVPKNALSVSDTCLSQTDMSEMANSGRSCREVGSETEKPRSISEEFRSQSVPPGFAEKIGEEVGSCGFASNSGSSEYNYGHYEENELFVPVDGEDWFDLQLDPDFVRQVTSAYSDLSSFDVGSLPSDILKIRIPPKLAFELFQQFSMAWLQKSVDPSVDPENFSDTSNGQDNEYETDDDEIIQHIVEMEKVTSESSPSLEKIMELEAKLSARNERDTKTQLAQVKHSYATRLKLDKLHTGFPSLPRTEIEYVFAKCKSDYDNTLETLKNSNRSKFVGIKDTLAGTSKLKSQGLSKTIDGQQGKSGIGRNPSPVYVSKQNEESMTATDWRKVAVQHHLLVVDYQQKMDNCLRSGAGKSGASDHYLQTIRLHTAHRDRANDKAKDLILKEFKANNTDSNTIDLHHLYVTEALDALEEYLKERIRYINKKMIRRLDVKVITGVGNNSRMKRARLMPAVVEYARSKHLSFIQMSGQVVVSLRYMETRMYNDV